MTCAVEGVCASDASNGPVTHAIVFRKCEVQSSAEQEIPVDSPQSMLFLYIQGVSCHRLGIVEQKCV